MSICSAADAANAFLDALGIQPPHVTDEMDAAVSAEREAAARAAALAKDEARQRELLGWGMPAKDVELYRESLLDLDRTAIAAARSAARQTADTFTVLGGPPSTGKTTAAGWWLTQAPQRRPVTGGLSLEAPCFLHSSHIHRIDPFKASSMRRIEYASALVLDDLGDEVKDASGWWVGKFAALIKARENTTLPTLITTNLTTDELREQYRENWRDINRILRRCGRYKAVT